MQTQGQNIVHGGTVVHDSRDGLLFEHSDSVLELSSLWAGVDLPSMDADNGLRDCWQSYHSYHISHLSWYLIFQIFY